jgi:uncharacterized membrane protein
MQLEHSLASYQKAHSSRSQRVVSVDLLRGFVMMLMALDHTREYFSGLPFLPEDLNKTFGALFFTRVITHLCAPAFFLLTGTGAYLSVAGGKPLPEVSRFFWSRGLWLIFLELTVLRFAWDFTLCAGCANDLGARLVHDRHGVDRSVTDSLDRRLGRGNHRAP